MARNGQYLMVEPDEWKTGRGDVVLQTTVDAGVVVALHILRREQGWMGHFTLESVRDGIAQMLADAQQVSTSLREIKVWYGGAAFPQYGSLGEYRGEERGVGILRAETTKYFPKAYYRGARVGWSHKGQLCTLALNCANGKGQFSFENTEV